MGWEWMPETPEEIAEHQRMRRELIECRQMYDSGKVHIKRRAGQKSVLVGIFAVIAGLYFIFKFLFFS